MCFIISLLDSHKDIGDLPPFRPCLTVTAQLQSPQDWMVCHHYSAFPRERWSLCRPMELLSACQDTRRKVSADDVGNGWQPWWWNIVHDDSVVWEKEQTGLEFGFEHFHRRDSDQHPAIWEFETMYSRWSGKKNISMQANVFKHSHC